MSGMKRQAEFQGGSERYGFSEPNEASVGGKVGSGPPMAATAAQMAKRR